MKRNVLNVIFRIAAGSVPLLLTLNPAFGQLTPREAMQRLEFMVGDWVGISTTFEEDTIATQVPAFEKISYRLDKHIITIDLHAETLQLHTVIYYDENDSTYYYNPYYKGGVGRYRATFREGKLIVSPNAQKRFIFQPTPEGGFKEYGEKRENGRWVKYFEDIFKKSP